MATPSVDDQEGGSEYQYALYHGLHNAIFCKISTTHPFIHKLHFLAVDDASGHYSAGFFYGNNYWTGSISLCMEIKDAENHLHWAPFDTGFFVLKTNFNDTRFTETVIKDTRGKEIVSQLNFILCFFSNGRFSLDSVCQLLARLMRCCKWRGFLRERIP